jgi:hypothetical protein
MTNLGKRPTLFFVILSEAIAKHPLGGRISVGTPDLSFDRVSSLITIAQNDKLGIIVRRLSKAAVLV